MYKKILIPVDVSVTDDTQNLLNAAKTLTEAWDCEVHVATVIPDVGMAIVGTYMSESLEAENRKAALDQLDAAIAQSGLKAQRQVLNGTVYDSVIEAASELGADLIIIGAHQPKLRDYLLGANAAKVVRHSKQSVLVVRSAS